MRAINTEIEELIGTFLNVLDEDTKQLSLTLERLDILRGLVIKRDEEGLKELLEKIRIEGIAYRQTELKREEIISQLAKMFDCKNGQINLSKLCSFLDEPLRTMVAGKKEELTALVDKLRIEQRSTNLFIKECSRLNKLLLQDIFGSSSSTITYDSRGTSSWQAQKGLMNLRM